MTGLSLEFKTHLMPAGSRVTFTRRAPSRDSKDQIILDEISGRSSNLIKSASGRPVPSYAVLGYLHVVLGCSLTSLRSESAVGLTKTAKTDQELSQNDLGWSGST